VQDCSHPRNNCSAIIPKIGNLIPLKTAVEGGSEQFRPVILFRMRDDDAGDEYFFSLFQIL
jgi:hypothetical protein